MHELKMRLEVLSMSAALGNPISWVLMFALSGYTPSGISLGCTAFIWYTVLKYNETARELWNKWKNK